MQPYLLNILANAKSASVMKVIFCVPPHEFNMQQKRPSLKRILKPGPYDETPSDYNR